ncbi:hypothetical protein [Enterococcus olivae]
MILFRLVILLIVISTLALLGFKVWSNDYLSKTAKRVYLAFFLIVGGAMLYMLFISMFFGSNF